MPTVAKKLMLQRLKSPGKVALQRKPSPRKSSDQFDPVADLEKCKKIAKTVDVEAFMAFHRTNTATQKHWESKE